MERCDLSGYTFDVTGSAAMYSQMAGVLAAFAFAAISLVLPAMSRRRARAGRSSGADEGSRSESLVLLALVAAFVGLLIATLQYAVLSGERGCALVLGRAASEEFLGGVAFAFSVLLLMYAIVQLIASFRVPALSFHARLIVVLLGAPLAALFLVTGAVDVAATPWNPVGKGDFTPNLTELRGILSDWSAFIAAGLSALCALAWLLGRKARTEPDDGTAGMRSRLRVAFPYLSLLLAVGAVVRSVGLDVLSPRARIADFEVVLWLAVCLAVLFFQAVLLSFERGTECTNRKVTRPADGPGTVVRPRWTWWSWLRVEPPPSAEGPSTDSGNIQETLEVLTRDVLVKRSLETFPAGYLNHISIIQGVALGLLAQQSYNGLTVAGLGFDQRVGLIGEAVFVFACIVIVSYEYIWFLTIMRWIPRFLDTLVPLALGLAEVIPIFLMPHFGAWLVSVSIFAAMGAAAFKHSLSNLTESLFAGGDDSFGKVRRLLRQLVSICLGMAGIIGVCVALEPQNTGWFRMVAPWGLLSAVPAIVIINERALDEIYSRFGLRRRGGRSLSAKKSPDVAGPPVGG